MPVWWRWMRQMKQRHTFTYLLISFFFSDQQISRLLIPPFVMNIDLIPIGAPNPLTPIKGFATFWKIHNIDTISFVLQNWLSKMCRCLINMQILTVRWAIKTPMFTMSHYIKFVSTDVFVTLPHITPFACAVWYAHLMQPKTHIYLN